MTAPSSTVRLLARREYIAVVETRSLPHKANSECTAAVGRVRMRARADISGKNDQNLRAIQIFVGIGRHSDLDPAIAKMLQSNRSTLHFRARGCVSDPERILAEERYGQECIKSEERRREQNAFSLKTAE